MLAIVAFITVLTATLKYNLEQIATVNNTPRTVRTVNQEPAFINRDLIGQ